MTTRKQIDGLIERSELTTRSCRVQSETLDEKNRSVEAVLATEAPVLVIDWNRWQVIEEILLMSGYRKPASGQVPLLDTHDRSTVQKQLGSTRNLRVEGDKLVGRNFFSTSNRAEHAWTLTKEGHLTDISVGYRVINSAMIPQGEKAVIEGRSFQASPTRDLRITTEWMHGETSTCPIGADKDAKNRNKHSILLGERTMDEKFKQWLIARGENPDTLDETKRAELEAEWKAEQSRSEPAKPPKKKSAKGGTSPNGEPDDGGRTEPAEDPEIIARRATQAGIEAERKRINDIRALGGDDVPAEVIERCITEGKSVEDARSEVLTEIRKERKNVSPNIQVGGSFNRQTLVDSLLIRSGYEDVVRNDKNKGEERFEAARRFRSMRLFDVCRQSLVTEGRDVPIEFEDVIRSAFTTASLPVALGEYINKTLLKGYQSPQDTWSLWCSIGNTSDFKTMTRVRVTDLGDWEEIGAAGELKHGSFGEEYEQYKIATYGKLLVIDRQTIINDDLNTLTKASFFSGRRSRLLISKLVYTHLLANGNMQDGIALFYATTHLNLNTSNSLTSGHLGTAKTAMRVQKDKDNQPIDLPPAVLLVPPELEQTALELLTASTVVITGTTDLVKPNVNVHADGKLKLGVESRLSNSAYTGYSATTWYLMASPVDADNIEVSFLNGRQTPTVQQVTLAPGQLGMGWQMFIDVGCKALDWRGMQKNTA